MAGFKFYTPYIGGQQVRIPAEGITFDRAPRVLRVWIPEGVYPVVTNGVEVTDETLRIPLGGWYSARPMACGLRCRCNTEIRPIKARRTR